MSKQAKNQAMRNLAEKNQLKQGLADLDIELDGLPEGTMRTYLLTRKKTLEKALKALKALKGGRRRRSRRRR